jgi:hypothetical protein
MDTRYWGPSGWRLLHLISFSTAPERQNVEAFFNTLAYVLPCKYCRKSFSENISKDPIEDADSIPEWLWRMHNRVNAKLRAQKLCTARNPSFQSVKDVYTERLDLGCTRTSFEGWEFLFSIAEGHPLSRQGRSSVPIAGHPALETLTDPLERNRWNVMTPEERMKPYRDFWTLLPKVLPFSEWSEAWKMSTAAIANRKTLLKSLWSIRCELESKLELLNRTTYNSLCRELQSHRSGCAKSVRGKTCRKKRAST